MPELPDSNPIGFPFIELQSVDSTNNYAMALAHEGLAQHGMAVFSHEQTAGKGQRGKSWLALKGSNIVLSLIIKPDALQLTQQFQLSALVAVAVHQFLSHYAGEETKIKWPNDVYWRDRKAAGILIENIISSKESGGGKWQWAIAGIGININQTEYPPELQNPVSLKQITGRTYSPIELSKELCQLLDLYYHKLINNGFSAIYECYQQNLYKKNKPVRLKKGNRVFEALILGVAENGQLVTQHGIEERFDFGEVEWVGES